MKNQVFRLLIAAAMAFHGLCADGAEARFRAAARSPGAAEASAAVRSLLGDWPPAVPLVVTEGGGGAGPLRGARTRALALLSPAHGTVRRIAEPRGSSAGPVFVLMQDVHANGDAQTNLARALTALVAGDVVDRVGLEGGWGVLPLAPYREFQRPEAVRRAAESLFKSGRISGPVFAGLTGRGDYFGLEEEAGYLRNVEAYRTARSAVDSAIAAVDGVRRDLARGKTALNSELRRWDHAVESHAAGQLGLGGLIETLAVVDATAPLSERVGLFRRAWKAEKSLPFSRVEQERTALIERLVSRLAPTDLSDLRRRAIAHRAGEIRTLDFYRNLGEFCRRAGASMADYPALREYIDYVRLADRIEVEGLLRDVRTLERRVYRRLARTPEEWAWVVQTQRVRLAAKLVDYALTPDEWSDWRRMGPGPWNLRPFEAFYEAADARDAQMTSTALALARGVPPDRAVALVAGGYHAAGITRRLTAAGAVVIQWTPRLVRAEGTKGSVYLSVFDQEKTPLENLMLGERLFLAPPVADALRTDAPFAVLGADRLERKELPLSEGERRLMERFLQSVGGRNIELLGARWEPLAPSPSADGKERVVFVVRSQGRRWEIIVYAANKTGLLRAALRASRWTRIGRLARRWARRAAKAIRNPAAGPTPPPDTRGGRRRFMIGAVAIVLAGASEKARALVPGHWLALARERARPFKGGDKARAMEAFFSAWRDYSPRPDGPARDGARREALARAALVSPGFAQIIERLATRADEVLPDRVDPRQDRDDLNEELLPEGWFAEVEWVPGEGRSVLTLVPSRILEIEHFAVEGKPYVSYLARGDGSIPAREAGYSTHEGVIVVREEAVEQIVMNSFWPQFDSILRERSPSLLAELRRVLTVEELSFFLRHARFFALRGHFAEEFRKRGRPFLDSAGALRANLSPDWQPELREYLDMKRALGEDNPDLRAVKGKLIREFARAVRAHELAHERALPTDGEPIAYINEILVAPLSVFGAVRMAFRATAENLPGLTAAEARKILSLIGRALGVADGPLKEEEYFRAMTRIDFGPFLRKLEEEYRREFQRAPAVRADHLDTARRLSRLSARPASGRATSVLGVALAEAAGARVGVPRSRAGALYKGLAPLIGTLSALTAAVAVSLLPLSPALTPWVAPAAGVLFGAVFVLAHHPGVLRIFGLRPPVTDPDTDPWKTAAMAFLYAVVLSLSVGGPGGFWGGDVDAGLPATAGGVLWAGALMMHGWFDGWFRSLAPRSTASIEAIPAADARDLLPSIAPLGLDTVDRGARIRALSARLESSGHAEAVAARLRTETDTPALALLAGYLLGRAPARNAPEKPVALVALVAEKDLDERLRVDLEKTARRSGRAGRDVRLILTPDTARAAARLKSWGLDAAGATVAAPVATAGVLSSDALGAAVRRWGPPGEDVVVLLSCTPGFASLIPRDIGSENLPDAVAWALRVLLETLAAGPLAPVDFSTLLRAAEKIDQSA